MAESTIDLIFRIRKSGSGGKDAESDLKATKKAANDAVKALTGFDIAGLGAAGAIAGVGAAAVGAVKETLAWAGAIDKLSRNTGLTTEEASKLAIVAGDVGIEINTLERSLKAMNKDGLELNFETLKKVSAQYNATADPVKRLKIATDAFGAAAQDMSEILSRSPEELDQLAKSAQMSGRVMSQEGVAAAEQFEQSLKQLEDRAKGLQVMFGNAVIPVLNDAMDGFNNYAKTVAVVNLVIQKNIGVIDQQQLELRAAAVAAGDLSAVFTEQFDPAILATTDAVDRNAARIVTLGIASIDTSLLIDDLSASTRIFEDATNDAKAAQGDLNGVWGDAYTAIGNLTLAEEERQQIEDALAIASGKLTVEDILRREAVETLTKQLDNGVITQQQYIDKLTALSNGSITARDSIYGVRDAIDSLKDKTVTVTYQQVGSEDFGGAGDVYVSPYSGGGTEPPPVVVPPGNVGPQMSTGRGGGSGGGTGGGVTMTNNFYISNPDPAAVAKQVSIILAAQARAYKAAGVSA